MTDLHVWKTTWWELYNNKYPWLSRHKLIIFKFFFGYQDSYCVGNCEAWRKPTAIVTGGFSKGLDWKRLQATTKKKHPFECLANKFIFVDMGNWMETNIWAKNIHCRWSKKQQRCGNWVKNPLTPLPWHVFPPFSSGFDAGMARWKGGWHLAVEIRKLISTRLQMERRPNPMGNPMESWCITAFSSGFPWFCPPPVWNCSELLRN